MKVEQSAAARHPAPPPTPIYATVNDFCAMFGIGRTTLYEAMKLGHVIARKIGSRTLVSVASGLSWIEKQPPYRPN